MAGHSMIRSAVVFVCVALLAACSSDAGGPAATATAGQGFTATAATAASTPADYRLSTGDLLDVSVFQVPDLTKSVQVDAAGLISLPLIGQVKAGGRTTHELENQIAAKLKARYLQSPQVSVFLKSSAGQQVSVDGAVRTPGTYAIQGQLSLSQVLARAGGASDVADTTGILVFRDIDGQRQAAKFNLDRIRSGADSDPPLYAGDTVVVDTSGTASAWKSFKDTIPAVGLFAAFAR